MRFADEPGAVRRPRMLPTAAQAAAALYARIRAHLDRAGVGPWSIRTVAATIERHPALHGTWNVAAEPIAKRDLLEAIRSALGLDVEIVPDDRVRIDRSLDASGFSSTTGWKAPGWDEMVTERAADAPAHAVGAGVARG